MYAVPGFATDLCQNGSLVDGDGPWGGGGYCNSKPCKAYFSALYGETETVRRDIVLHRFVYPLFERSLLQKPGSDKSRSIAKLRQRARGLWPVTRGVRIFSVIIRYHFFNGKGQMFRLNICRLRLRGKIRRSGQEVQAETVKMYTRGKGGFIYSMHLNF